MIYQLAIKKQKPIAGFLFIIFFVSNMVPSWAFKSSSPSSNFFSTVSAIPKKDIKVTEYTKNSGLKSVDKLNPTAVLLPVAKTNEDIGGPSQPEMSSFRPVDANNMVNLFTGDFSYNIPLLDVGGYPINIFYDGSITPEQEASWVGLGWNINPGAVTRNMRGVPDDFDGTDIMTQTQAIKPDNTFGVTASVDVELVGIKGVAGATLGSNMGLSFNNYLGPAMEMGLKGGVNFQIAKFSMGEKSSLGIGAKVNGSLNLSSRAGATFGLSTSLSANFQFQDKSISNGFGASTSYNSRTGIRSLTLFDQLSFSYQRKSGVDSKPYNYSNTATLWSSTISFLKPSYVPSIRMPITNTSGSGHVQLGTGAFFAEADGEIEVSAQHSEIKPEDMVQKKPMYGYFNYEKANNDPYAVLDFVRLGDKEVTPETPIISAPQYTYDVFAISGEGTGGTIRAYRNDLGYVWDSHVESKESSWSAGLEISPPGQYGGNFNTVHTPTIVGKWENQNLLSKAIPFQSAKGLFENVYFKNPGENCVLNLTDYASIGGTGLVRFKLDGLGGSPILRSTLQVLPKDGSVPDKTTLAAAELPLSNNNSLIRKKRTQVINFLSAKDASIIGLDKKIKSYDATNILDGSNNLSYASISRVSLATDAETFRKSHHISQINVTEADGKRYIYGIPVYNKVQKDFTFTTSGGVQADGNNMVNYTPGDNSTSSPYLDKHSYEDGYLQITETPAYAHSFLLSGLLSTDYIDVTGDGITEDDLGNAVKFNYTKIGELFKWRSPHIKIPLGETQRKATYNPGSRSNAKDNKGLITYGERESWYMHSVESKTMIAIFTLGTRFDGKSAINENGGVDDGSNALRKLEKIDLYNKSDIKLNGLGVNGAKPVKTVHFDYSYKLCKGTPDNTQTSASESGKLTLDRIYFTFNGQENKLGKNLYVFGYENLKKKKSVLATGGTYASTIDNPNYAYNVSDRWGNYKPISENPGGMSNIDYPYSLQNPGHNEDIKDKIDNYASVWNLKSILLPSGGQIEVNYEADDYSYVQNKRAAAMFQITGLGIHGKNLSNEDVFSTTTGNRLYEVSGINISENNCVFVNVPEGCNDKAAINQKYLHINPLVSNQLAFKIMVKMPNGGYEYLTSYAVVKDYGIVGNNHKNIWIELEKVDGISPLALTAIEYLREQLPGQAFTGYDVSGETTIQQIIDMYKGVFSGLLSILSDPINYIRVMIPNSAQSVELSQSFVRLYIPDATPVSGSPYQVTAKYGGGRRVKSIILKDNWDKMTSQYGAEYGQEYDYTTTEKLGDNEIKISSGVASYEPSIGGEENPFQTMFQVANTVPLGPTSYGSIEMPILDGFFQASNVGYSKVTVRSNTRKAKTTGLKSHSGIGKQVSEFYTAKDFPVKCYNTSFDENSLLESHDRQTTSFWHKSSFDAKALSQGFLVELNDMHGKMKSQSSYAENDDKTPINYTENFYRNTGEKELDEKFDFVDNTQGGLIFEGNIGVDIELMTDAREFSTKSTSKEIQAQLDIIPNPIWPFFPFVWPVSGESENTYRAVTTTKVVNYHSIVDEVVVIDKGSTVSTKNLVYDAETGQVIVSRIQNEFNNYIYNTTYPAYWAYGGMGLAYKNTDAVYENVNFLDGRITPTANFDAATITKTFESGDEVYLINSGSTPSEACAAALVIPNTSKLWVFDVDKNNSSLTNEDITVNHQSNKLYFVTKDGVPYTKNGSTIRIIRSGKRNILNASTQSVTSMISPIVSNMLTINQNSKVVNASAVEYKEKWQTDNDVFRRYETVINSCTNAESEVENCAGHYDKQINPYCKGLLGTFRPWRNLVFYNNKTESDPTAKTNIPNNGFIQDFTKYWNFNNHSNLLPVDLTNSKWVWNSEVTRVNARGQEIETKNALNIYTSAQYGYSKNLPLAIANNSKSNEMFSEGFEDEGFNEKLNINYNESSSIILPNLCGKKQIEFKGLGNATIITDANSIGINPHSGKSILKVTNNSSVIKPININNPSTNYGLSFTNENFYPLVNIGGNAVSTVSPAVFSGSQQINNVSTTFPTGWVGVYGNVGTATHLINGNPFSSGQTSTSQYFKVNICGDYNFMLKLRYNELNQFDNTVLFNVYVKDIDDHIIAEYIQGDEFLSWNATITCPGNCYTGGVELSCDQTHILHLNPGIYKIETEAKFNHPTDNALTTWLGFFGVFNLETNIPGPSYKDLTTITTCPHSIPIIGSEDMSNPIFAPLVGSKMHFSAWVRQDSRQTDADGKPTYANSSVSIDFGTGNSNNVTIHPNGNIIEGWQLVEGEFTVPASGATSMKLILNNSNGTANYWDDIRIHPYNANMKSYVYNPVNLRLVAELDENNYAKFYEYDKEGTLIRTKAETKEGIKTISETRSAKQKVIETIQE